jgi:hypothetical protein
MINILEAIAKVVHLGVLFMKIVHFSRLYKNNPFFKTKLPSRPVSPLLVQFSKLKNKND